MSRILTSRVMGAAALGGLALTCASLVYLWFVRPPSAGEPAGPLDAMTVLPGPSSTPTRAPSTLTAAPPTPFPTPTPGPGDFRIGGYVQIGDTGGEGLRIRAEPGLETEVIFSGFDAEVFLVTDGPRQADGYTWWHLTASYDQARAGWAAQDYLDVLLEEQP